MGCHDTNLDITFLMWHFFSPLYKAEKMMIIIINTKKYLSPDFLYINFCTIHFRHLMDQGIELSLLLFVCPWLKIQ